jgi:hypothetical protein
MLPRFSKNYSIIPQLAAGPIKLQILFQQNQYPAQTFNIQVPEDGYRGFLLTRKDNGFALFDLQQRFYLMPGDEGEDHLPETNASGSGMLLSENEPANKVVPVVEEPVMPQPTKKHNRGVIEKPIEETVIAINNEPQFINDIELNNERTPVQNIPERQQEQDVVIQEQPTQTAEVVREVPQQETNEVVLEEAPQQEIVQQETTRTEQPPQETAAEEQQQTETNIANETAVEESGTHDTETEMGQPVPALTENAAPIINSDCPEAMSDSKFDEIFTASRAKSSDDKRIALLMKKAGENCFTTRQVFLLSRQLQTESMRYSFLKKVYSHITDQQNFYLLGDALFKTMEWKSYFKLIYE